MLLSLGKLALFGMIGLSVLYLLIGIYARSVQREALERQWDEGDGAGERADYVREGMDAYRNSLRRRLILLVFVLPVVAVAVVIWAINFS